MQRQGVDVHRRVIDGHEVAGPLSPALGFREHVRRNCAARCATLSLAASTFPSGVVDRDAFQVLAVSKTVYDPSQLAGGTALQDGINRFLQAFGEDFAAPREVRAQAAFFAVHLITRDDKRDQRDAGHEDKMSRKLSFITHLCLWVLLLVFCCVG